MKKKSLLIFLLAAISSLSVVAAAGCGANNGGDNGGNVGEDDGATTHEHNYGTWTVEEANKPTQTSTGKATRSCGENDSTQEITLPALSDESYVITGDTATVGVAGTGTYSITITDATYGTVTLSFTAATPAKEDEKQEVVVEKVYETVETTVDFTKAIAAGATSGSKPSQAITFDRFTLTTGAYVESSTAGLKIENGDINTQNTLKALYFTLNGEDGANHIKFSAKAASGSGNCTVTLYKVVEGGEDVLVYSQNTTSTVTEYEFGYDFTNGKAGEIELTAGEYYLGSTDGSVRLGNMVICEKLEKSEVESITVSGGTNKFLVGSDFSSSGITVTAVYKNGKTAVVENYSVNSNAYDKTKSGVYTIDITYGADDKTFEASYKVGVYAVDSLSAYGYSLNSSRVTLPVQKIFLADSTFNSNNLAVHANGKIANLSEEDKAAGISAENVFVINNYSAQVSANTKGVQTVTVSAYDKTTSYVVVFVDKAEITSLTTVKVAKVESAKVENGVLTVNSINDAIQFFKVAQVADSAQKVIEVAEGEYYEKVEIDLPNVTLKGANTAYSGSGDVAKGDKTVIYFDALNGISDPSNTTTYSTDGSAAVSIRSTAVNFSAENITFKNAYNTNDLYEQSKLIAGSGTQAVACLIQADKAVFTNVTFTGYHDTLYTMYGRHVFQNCYIEGRTDYIFGYNSTSYFKGCTIVSLGAGVDQSNGGYVVATKGASKSNGDDAIKYGYIFDSCTLKGDENVRAGSVSLARGWDKYMTMAVINCSLDKSFSKEGYGEPTSYAADAEYKKDLNDRYTKMNAEPVASQLFEYGNTGDGALTYEAGFSGLLTSTVGEGESAKTYNICTILTAEQAAEYTNLSTIFAAENGKLKYSDNWAGSNSVYSIAFKTSDSSEESATIGNITVSSGSTPIVDSFSSALTIPEGKMVEGFYTDASFTTAYVAGNVTADFTLYVKLVDSDPTIKKSVTYNFAGATYAKVSAGESATYDKLAVSGNSGSFEQHNSSYYKLKGDATITLTVTAGTVVKFTTYDKTLAVEGTATPTLDDSTAVAGGNGYYTITATTDGTIVLKNSGTQLYISSIEVTVPLKQVTGTYTYTYSADTIASDDYMEINDCVANGDWLRFNTNDSYIKFNVKTGTVVTITSYNGNIAIDGVEQTAVENVVTYTATKDGEITISRVSGKSAYLKKIEVVAPKTVEGGSSQQNTITAFTVSSDDATLTDFNAETPTNWDADGIIKLYSVTDKQWSVASNAKKYTDVNGVEHTSTNRLQSNSGKTYMEIDLSAYEGSVKVQVYFMSGKSGDTRTLSVLNADGETVGSKDSDGTAIGMGEFTLACGSVYTLKCGASLNFYAINIIPVEA
jgi:pectin methylesterase-like acyl-CoA thioesterase